MKRLLFGFFLILCTIGVYGCSFDELDDLNADNQNTDIKDKDDLVSEPVIGEVTFIAIEFVKDIIEEDFDKVLAGYSYNDEMYAWFEKISSQETITIQNASLGELVEIMPAYVIDHKEVKTVKVPVKFSIMNCNFSISFNEQQQIIGLFYEEYDDTPPEVVVLPEEVIETEMSFTSGAYTLPGTLTTPRDGKNFPIVIIVHGSGAVDRNCTIYDNTTYRDIAWQLAKLGIASYRYDKRSYVYKNDFLADTTITVNEETIQDALTAVTFVSEIDSIDESNIFVLGHSLGGFLIPRIAEQSEKAAGYIIMAGPSGNLLDLMANQYQYLFELDGEVTEEESETINQCNDEIQSIRDKKAVESDAILGAYAPYWYDLENYQVLELAKNITKPVMVLQGERDYQVPMEQYRLWYDTFSTKVNWRFRSYDSLNHLMIAGEGTPSPEEYKINGEVDIRVTQDIFSFIIEKGVAVLTPMEALDKVKELYAANFEKVVQEGTTDYSYKLPSADYYLTYDSYELKENYYTMHLYEFVLDDPDTGIGHTVTYGWYAVDILSGEVTDNTFTAD